MDQRLIFVAMMLLIVPSIAALDSWVKVNSRPVCFGARDNTFGSFNVPYGGKIAAVKLVYLSGYVTCAKSVLSHWSFWGCGDIVAGAKRIDVIITTSSNTIIMPVSPFLTDPAGKWYELPGYNSFSPEIIPPRFSPYSVSSGQELRVWYSEDLADSSESDNGGLVCCDVYGLYI